LLDRSRAGAVTILDVRPEDEFALGHVPGAINIPLRTLESRLSELDSGLPRVSVSFASIPLAARFALACQAKQWIGSVSV